MSLVPHPMTLKDEVARLSGMIGLARQRVAIGAAVDLEPVGEGIVRLCAMVSSLPLEQGRSLRGDLEALSDRLSKLGGDIEARLAANDQTINAPAP